MLLIYNNTFVHRYKSQQSKRKYSSNNFVDEKKKRENEESEKIKKEKKLKTIYFRDKNIIINGLYLISNNYSYKIDTIESTRIKKIKSEQSKIYAPILILIGILTFSFIIGILILSAGISGLFHKEYVLIINYNGNDILLKTGKKKIIERISLRLNEAMKNS